MANDVVRTQLPIMVRRPRAVWPGLDRMDLHRKQIAGDGNCLFASLADQLYGQPDQHLEIRAAIIEHMRTYRPLFESFAIKDDIQQKRATRAATNAIRNTVSDDNFEDYLTIMCRSGTYGGEPELMAFVQCYDQDVLVHLPRMEGYPEAIPYINQHRPAEADVKPQLHLCYGGDEVTFPHYDSARKNTPPLTEVLSMERSKKPQPVTAPTSEVIGMGRSLSSRAIRGSRSDISRDLMHDMIVKGSREFKAGFDDSDRARSPSASSSHYSSSSKRSFDDDGEPRASKRADRRKSTRIRGVIDHASLSPLPSIKLNLSTHSQPVTPQSTQSSDDSYDQSDHNLDTDLNLSQEPDEDNTFSQEVTTRSGSAHRPATAINRRVSVQSLSQTMMAEPQHETLQA